MGNHLSPDIQSITEPPPTQGTEEVYFKRNVVIGIGPLTVSSMTRSGGTVTVTTSIAHGFQVDQLVTIAGANEIGYNNIWTVLTVPSTTTFTFFTAGTPSSPATGTITAVVDPVDVTSAELFETGVGKLVLTECDDPFPAWESTPMFKITPLGDYDIALVPTSLDPASDLVNSSTAGHKFKLYKGNVTTPPSDGVYKAHFEWTKC